VDAVSQKAMNVYPSLLESIAGKQSVQWSRQCDMENDGKLETTGSIVSELLRQESDTAVSQ
jgi:hypothetical protein